MQAVARADVEVRVGVELRKKRLPMPEGTGAGTELDTKPAKYGYPTSVAAVIYEVDARLQGCGGHGDQLRTGEQSTMFGTRRAVFLMPRQTDGTGRWALP